MSVARLHRFLKPTALRSPVFATRFASSVHNNDPDVLAKEKARNLKGTQESSAPHKDHAPGWNEKLASSSEAAIKADQAGPTGKPGKELQDATVKQTHKHHHTDEGHKGAESHAAKANAPQNGKRGFGQGRSGRALVQNGEKVGWDRAEKK